MTSSRFHGRGTLPQPRETVYTLNRQKKRLASPRLLSAKRFRFNVTSQQTRRERQRALWGMLQAIVEWSP